MLKIVSLTVVRQIVSGLLQVANLVIVARFLTVPEMGQYTLAILLPTLLAPMLTLGIQSANIYGIGRKLISPSEVLYVNVIILGLIALIGVGVTLVFLYFFSSAFFPGLSYELLILTAVAILPVLFLTVIPTIFQAIQNYTVYNAIAVVNPLVLLCVTVTGLIISNSLKSVLISYLIANSIVFIGITYLAIKHIKLSSYSVVKFSKDFFKYSIASHLSNIVTLLNYRSSILLLGHFTVPAQVALYSVGLQMVEKLWLPSQAVSMILLPKITHEMNDNAKEVSTLTVTTARLVLIITTILALGFLVLSPFIIQIMFGVNYKDSVYVCLFLAVGIVLWAPSRILASDIAARGLANVNLHNAIYVLIINIVLSVILIYQYGYLGAAVATSIAYSCDFFLRMYAYQKLTHLNVYKEMIPKKQDIEMMIDVAKRKVYAK